MKVLDVYAQNIELNKVQVYIQFEGYQEALRLAQKLNDLKDSEIDIEAKKHREKRSLNANAMLWACIGELAKALDTDKDSVYLKMLKRYGKYTYICVPPQAVEQVKQQWKECEYIGDITINGRPASQMLCYFGSSTYNTQEFAKLLDGVIGEMHEMGLETPSEKEEQAMLDKWAKEVESG